MPRSGTFTHWMEIPLEIEYTVNPKERQTQTYQGCQAHIEIDNLTLPTDAQMLEIIEKETDSIEMECWEDVKDNEIPS